MIPPNPSIATQWHFNAARASDAKALGAHVLACLEPRSARLAYLSLVPDAVRENQIGHGCDCQHTGKGRGGIGRMDQVVE